MVEQAYSLDAIFGSLSDPTRRDILKRLTKREMSVSEIAKHYDFSFAGIAKHLQVLQRAGLISKTRQGKEQIITVAPLALSTANKYLESYSQRLDSLDMYLKSVNKKGE
ncbi:MAG TPA: metalloregulator ArsR/SmtB family transcription factor [Candidatus Saccharimonadales bacterium]|jgi:DNA-binding transcriptional ArsR family regulator